MNHKAGTYEKLIKYLKDELDYSTFEIKSALREVKRLDKESAIRLDELLDGKDIMGYSFRDYSVNGLIKTIDLIIFPL